MSIKDTIVSLKTEVEELKKSMEGVSADVKKLNTKVFPSKEEPAKGFVMHSSETKTQHIKHVSKDRAAFDRYDRYGNCSICSIDPIDSIFEKKSKKLKRHF